MSRMGAFAKYAQRQNAEKKREGKVIAPKGFDILLADVVSELHLNEDQIRKLGELTATRRSGLARATLGHQVWYRRSQLVELLKPVELTITVDEFAHGEQA